MQLSNSSTLSKCHFTTERLNIFQWHPDNNNPHAKQQLAEQITAILTPKVTQNLPPSWSNITTMTQAEKWIDDRLSESAFICITQQNSTQLIGLIFLFQTPSEHAKPLFDLRFGYLLAENYWGKGLGSELIAGLVNWCEQQKSIHSLAGGVDIDNIGSIKVLERNGFTAQQEENSSTSGVIFYQMLFQQ